MRRHKIVEQLDLRLRLFFVVGGLVSVFFGGARLVLRRILRRTSQRNAQEQCARASEGHKQELPDWLHRATSEARGQLQLM